MALSTKRAAIAKPSPANETLEDATGRVGDKERIR